MKQTKPDRIESKCGACRGTGFAVVKQPAQPGRRIYPPRCAKCHGSGRIRKTVG
jgi:DnaJ-class molecular chaperone